MILWFLGRAVLVLCSCFFIFFGVVVLIASYSLKDPFLFIMTFLASTMMILISAAIGFGIVVRAVRDVRAREDGNKINEKDAQNHSLSHHEEHDGKEV